MGNNNQEIILKGNQRGRFLIFIMKLIKDMINICKIEKVLVSLFQFKNLMKKWNFYNLYSSSLKYYSGKNTKNVKINVTSFSVTLEVKQN